MDRPPRDDADYMRRALELAGRGWGRVAPNPLVGAVVVRSDRIVGEGWHREFGAPHAEVEALRAAGGAARDSTVYVTLEPCSHAGKTPPCTEALLAAGVRRVVYACADPNARARGGADVLRAAGVEIVAGVEEGAARTLNQPFLRAHDRSTPRRPWTELKLALSLDGRMADHSGHSGWITGEEARAEVHRLRAGHDAIAVGIGTAMADDPRLTVRGGIEPRVPPIRVVFDRGLRLPLESRLARSALEVPVWIVADAGKAPPDRRAALAERGVRVIDAPSLDAALEALLEAGIRSLFCEGGAGLAASMLGADLVDRLILFHAPLLLGTGGVDPFRGIPSTPLNDARRWTHVRTEQFGPDTLIAVDH